jgi:hypothetical protein
VHVVNSWEGNVSKTHSRQSYATHTHSSTKVNMQGTSPCCDTCAHRPGCCNDAATLLFVATDCTKQRAVPALNPPALTTRRCTGNETRHSHWVTEA